MKYLRLHIFCLVAGIMFLAESMAQVTFNYDEITICEGSTFDLLNFRNNEVAVNVGWEITGWQDIVNTTVQPTVSPSVYTLEYREIANPSQIFTKTLTIFLRPKPTVSITPSGKQTVCIGDNVQIQKTGAADYDNIYWQHIETGNRYYTDDISFTATDAKTSYMLVATNNNCAALATAHAEFFTDDMNLFPIERIRLNTLDNTYNPTHGKGHYANYCSPVYLKDQVGLFSIVLYDDISRTSSADYWIFNDYFFDSAENDLYKVTRCEIIWDNQDAYTQGAPITGEDYFNTFTIETDIYFKGCNVTKTFTEKRYIHLNYDCSHNFQALYNCYASSGMGTFSFNIPDILDVQFVNKTTPGQYIPEESTIWYLWNRYTVLYDEQVPAVLVYDIKVTYKDLDETIQVYQFSDEMVPTCQKEMLINYFIRVEPLDFSIGGVLIEGCNNTLCSNKGVGNPARTLEITICEGEDAYFDLSTEIGKPLEIVWDNPERPLVWDPLYFYSDGDGYILGAELDESDYQYDFVDGKHTFKISMQTVIIENNAYFKVSPKDTTTYTGTLFGVPFAFKVNVVNPHIAVTDTVICTGQSIDLKTLERTEMADGPISWSASNTLVSPVVDTKYLAYGITRHKCKDQTDYAITDEVLVKVDAPVWTTTTSLITGRLGDQVSLAANLNTNARIITWYDENDNPVDETVTITALGITNYYAVVENACGSETVQMSILGIPRITAVDDNVSLTPCQNYVDVNVRANDQYLCANPVISLLGDSPFPGTYVVRNGNQVRYYPNFDVDYNYFGKTDSVRYSIACGADVDTAWVLFHYPQSLSPWIEVESQFNKTCFSVGDTIVEKITLRYNCTTNQDLRISFSLVSSLAYFEMIDNSIVLISNSYGRQVYELTAYFKVVGLKKFDENETVTSTLYIYNPSLGAIQLNNNINTGFTICPDYDLSITDCSRAELDLVFLNAVSYQITQQPQLPGATASIAGGKFVYLPPKAAEVKTDTVKYEIVFSDGTKQTGTITLKIKPCFDVILDATVNDMCNYDSCKYEGPSILINEVMITPSNYDGAIYGYQCDPENEMRGGEWIEIYNPHTCDSVDVSGYFLGNSTSDAPTCGNYIRNIGAAFVLPEGTVIPPMGFCVLRGQYAVTVDSARLVENGGNTVVINLMDHFDRFCLSDRGNRFWLPNVGGWFGFYNRDGIPQDAIYWGTISTDICSNCRPCNPQMAGTYNGVLASLDEFPASRKTRVSNFHAGYYMGLTPKRQPDGGAWDYNNFTPPTIGYCNGICNTRADSECSGTATVQASGGTGGPFSYQWDDPWQQTTETATGLCEGTYYCTITDNSTGLTEVVRVVVGNNPVNCPDVKMADDTVFIHTCKSRTVRIPLLENVVYTCDEPEVTLLSAPTVPGNTAHLVNDTLVFHIQNISELDSIQYKVFCDGVKPAADSAWLFVKIRTDWHYTDFTETLCQGDSILFGGLFRTVEGIYHDTLTALVTGCDSVVTMDLKFNPVYHEFISETICEGSGVFFGKGYYKTEGVYNDTLKTVLGCDSIITLNLTVKPALSVRIVEKVVCLNDTVHLLFTGIAPFELDYTFNGTRQTMTISGMDTVLVATLTGENPFIMHRLTGAFCTLEGDLEQGTEVDGVIWATRNVDTPDHFTATTEEAGLFYQWGKKVGWTTSGYMVNTNGGTTWDYIPQPGEKWEAENDPCPCGWRMPTYEEQKKLIDTGDREAIQNNVTGRLFGTEPNTVFLPYTTLGGWRNPNGSLYPAPHSDYWTATGMQTNNTGNTSFCYYECAYDLCFDWNISRQLPVPKTFCTLLRCVKDVVPCPEHRDTVMVNPHYQDSPVEETICQGDSIFFGTQYYKAEGIYTETLETVFGCDSIVTLDLKVNPVYQDLSVSKTICEGDSVFFGRKYYGEEGVYTDTLKTVLGCDSIVTLDLTVIPVPSVTVVEKAVCQNDTVHLLFTGVAPFELDYTFNGVRRKMTVSGMDTVVIATQTGENLFIMHSLMSGNGCILWGKSSDNDEGVEINGVIWATRNVDAPGTFTANPEDAGMFYQWNSTVGWSVTDPLVSTDGSTWNSFWDGNGAITWETTNNVCPAGYRIPTSAEQQSLINAGSQGTTINGVTGRIFGYGDNIIFLPAAGARGNSNGFLAYAGLSGFYWSNTQYDEAFAYRVSFNSSGSYAYWNYCSRDFGQSVRCVADNIPADTITVHPIKSDTTNISICANDSTLFNGKYYKLPGLYTDILETTFGCDSMATLNLKVNPVYQNLPVYRTICENDSIFFGNQYFKQEGLHTLTLETVSGCDSIVSLFLSHNPVYQDSPVPVIICQGDSVFFGKQYHKQPGIYNDTLKTIFGCDSIVSIDLKVNRVYLDSPVSETICRGDSVFFGSNYYKQEGIFSETLKTVLGCDSIVTIDLKVNPVYRNVSSEIICKGDSIFFENQYYKQPGTYNNALKTVLGCDSIITLHLTVQDSSLITITSDKNYICQDGEEEITLTAKVKAGNPSEIVWYDGDRTSIQPDRTSRKWNVIPLDSKFVYRAYAVDPVCGNSPYAYTTVYITNKVYLLLKADTTQVQIGDKVTLTVTPTNDEHGIYHWYDAFTGKPLGETTVNTFSYTLDEAGIFAFYVLTDNGYCPEAESNEVKVEVADYWMIPNIITPYNNNGLNDTFMTPNEKRPGYRVEIYNRYQQKVFEGDNGWDGTYRGKLADPGTYFFRIFMKDGRVLKGPLEVAKF